MTDRERCPECGRKLNGLMAVHENQEWPEWAANAILVLVALAILCGIAVLVS